MAKFYGAVGYGVVDGSTPVPKPAIVGDGVIGVDYLSTDPEPSDDYPRNPDIWEEKISERSYYGDVFKDSRQLEKGYGVNDNIKVNNRIGIMADAFAFEHFFAIRYVRWMGTRWKVSDVEVQRPRLILSIGGVYNGPEIDSV